jgi:hypothetical protein
MGKKTIGKAVGPFDKYTEVLIENIGTVGVPARKVCKVVQDEETGTVSFELTDPKPEAKKPAAKKAAKK